MNNKFLNTEKTLAYVDGTSIPKGHYLWEEKVVPIIDTLENHKEVIPGYSELRLAAYKSESDHLFFEGQYNKDLTKWKAKVAKIKKKYPKS